MAKKRKISVEKVIDASPEAIFAILSNPSMHPVIDGSGSVKAQREGAPQRLELGSQFGMDMRMGLSYKVANKVKEYEENRLIAWANSGGQTWKYELTSVEDGKTSVTETFDWSTAKLPLFVEIARFPNRNRKGMEKTLENLGEILDKEKST